MGPYDLLELFVASCERLHIPYFVTGSVAAMAYGEPRLTTDIDVVVDVDESHIQGLIQDFPPDRFYLSEEAAQEAITRRSQFNIIDPTSGLKIDVVVRQDSEFDTARFSRRRRVRPSPRYEADFASAEDVIIKKMEWYREGGSDKHLRDIAGILKVSAGMIDEAYIEGWVNRLDLAPIWEAITRRLKDA